MSNITFISEWKREARRALTIPVTYSYGNAVLGTGNISTLTSNIYLIGDNTCVFTTQLHQNAVIKSNSNVYIGHINTIIGNSVATFKKAPNVSLISNSFYIVPFSYTSLVKEENVGTGNISVFTSNATVIGNNTSFLTELDVNFQIFDNTSKTYPNLIGVIKTINSNTSATLQDLSLINGNNIAFRYYNPVSPNRSNTFVPNASVVNNALIEWGQSGLIRGIRQIKSFHAPIPDPITGVLVNFPATVHESAKISNIVNYKLESLHVHNIPSHQHTTEIYNVKEFNDEHSIVGSSLNKAIDSIPINRLIKKLADSETDGAPYKRSVDSIIKTIYGDPQIKLGLNVFDSVPNGFVKIESVTITPQPYDLYKNAQGNVIYVKNQNSNVSFYNTALDRFAVYNKLPPLPRITDSLNDSKMYYSAPKSAENITDAEKADLAARAGQKIQFSTDEDKQLTVTGLPAVVPGFLNAILKDENPANQRFIRPTYDEPRIEINYNYNKDLPISVLNLPPSTD